MKLTLQEEDILVSDLKQSFNINNMVLFAGVGTTRDELTEEICSLPWSCVVTTRRDEGFRNSFVNEGRRPKEYCSVSELPPKLFDRTSLPIIRLFGLEVEDEPDEDYELLEERQEDECKSMLSNIMGKLDIISQMIVIGYRPEMAGELKRTAMVVRWEKCQGGKLSFFNMNADSEECRKLRESALKRNFSCYEESLAAILGRRSRNDEEQTLEDYTTVPGHNLFYANEHPITINDRVLLRYRETGELLTEEKLLSIRPYGRIQQSRWFFEFLTKSAVYGPQWYGYLPQSEFYLRRPFEKPLVNLVCNLLDGRKIEDYDYSVPVIIDGDPGSSKSITLGALAYRVFMRKRNPVVFIHKTEMNLFSDISELDDMLQNIVDSGSGDARILIIWDGSAYHNIEKQAKTIAKKLDNRGRRFVLVCSAYRNMELGSGKPDGEGTLFYWNAMADGTYQSANKESAGVVCYNNCYFVHAVRELMDGELVQLKQKVSLYVTKDISYLMNIWNRLQAENNRDIFEYLYKLIIILQPALESGLTKEQQKVSNFVQEQLDKILERSSVKREKVLSPMAQALQEAGIDFSDLDLEEKQETDEIKESTGLLKFSTCVALFSRFKLPTPVPLALQALYMEEDTEEKDFYSSSNRELFNQITTSIPWIIYRENEEGDFCFYFRSTLEANIFLRNNPIDEEQQIDLVCKLLGYYAENCLRYNSAEPALKTALQRLLRMIGPNSDFKPFQDIAKAEHINLMRYLNKIIDKLAWMRNERQIPDEDASFATIEITFMREFYGTYWGTLNGAAGGAGSHSVGKLYPHIYTEDSYSKRLNYLNSAVELANASIDKLEHCQVERYGKRQQASLINTLTVELCHCKMELEKTWRKYKQLCDDNGHVVQIPWKSIQPLPYLPMYRMLMRALNNDPTNGYAYNALFSLFENEYEQADEKSKLELLSGIRMIVDDAKAADIQDRGSKGHDELSTHITRIIQYSSKTMVRISNILDGTCPEAFGRMFEEMLSQNNPAAIVFVCQQELDAAGISKPEMTAPGDRNNADWMLNSQQLEKCEEIRSFMRRREYADCIEHNMHALQLLLRVSWMCYNKQPLMDGKKECRLTYIEKKGQWADIRQICQMYENCAGENPKPNIVLIHALSIIQLTENYIEANDLLERLDESLFYNMPRMRVPYMICASPGIPRLYNGKVLAVREERRGYIEVIGVPRRLGSKEGIRFYKSNLGMTKMPEKGQVLTNFEIGLGYTGLSAYTARGRARMEARG